MTLRDEMVAKLKERVYIGDGVYAQHDGYQIWLHAGSNSIALEPEVMASLVAYATTVDRLIAEINKQEV